MIIVPFIDPNSKFPNVSPIHLLELCGLIPAWVSDDPELSFQEQVIGSYGFPAQAITGSVVDADGTYRYPGDPLLHPIAKWQRGGEVMYMYEYAVVAFIKDGVTFVTRVD